MENISDDFKIPEVNINIHRFKIRGSEVFCMLMDDQISIMGSFFERLDMGGISWKRQKIKHLTN